MKNQYSMNFLTSLLILLLPTLFLCEEDQWPLQRKMPAWLCSHVGAVGREAELHNEGIQLKSHRDISRCKEGRTGSVSTVER